MQARLLKLAAITMAAPILAFAAPASAAVTPNAPAMHGVAFDHAGQSAVMVEHGRHGKKRGWRRGRGNPHRAYHSDYGYRDSYRQSYRNDYRQRYYAEPVYRDTRIWRDRRDGNYYCRKRDGTTGTLIGAGVGALIGNEIAGRGDRTLGAILGAAGGAILGREIDRSNARCR